MILSMAVDLDDRTLPCGLRIAHSACAAQLSERYDGCGMGDHYGPDPAARGQVAGGEVCCFVVDAKEIEQNRIRSRSRGRRALCSRAST